MAEARVIVITGASSGIGRALAVEAARKGWRVLAVDRNATLLDETARRIREAGGSGETLAADVVDAATPQRIVDAALRAFGRIDVLVNNAGHGSPGRLLDQSDDALERQWQTHVAAPLRISRAALPAVRATRGSLVFVGSGLARVPAPNHGGYCAAKAAIRAAATQLRRELGSEGIAVTYVDPGVVGTSFSQNSGMKHDLDAIAATPERVARGMLRGIERRGRSVNPLRAHALGAMLGEFFPHISDFMIAHREKQPEAPQAKPAFAPTQPVVEQSAIGFDEALAPLARRMERVKLDPSFIRGLLNEGTRIELADAAMRWAGMPNKNERAALHEVLDALTAAGYLESAGDEEWIVRRAAD